MLIVPDPEAPENSWVPLRTVNVPFTVSIVLRHKVGHVIRRVKRDLPNVNVRVPCSGLPQAGFGSSTSKSGPT